MAEKANKRLAPRELNKDQWAALLDSISEKVKEEAFSQGLPITVVREAAIYKVYADGTAELVEDLPATETQLDKKIWRIE